MFFITYRKAFIMSKKSFFKQFFCCSAILIIALHFSCINADAGISDSEKINCLVEKGATKEILEKIPQDKLDDFYNKVIEGNLNCKSYSQKVVKEIPSDKLTRGAIDPSEIELSCTADFYVNSDNNVSWAVLSYKGKWADGKPYILGEDAVAFNWDSNKFVCDYTEFYAEYYKYLDDDFAYTAYSVDNPAQAALQGIAYYLDLSEISTSTGNISIDIKNRGFFGIVELMPTDTVKADNNTYMGTTLNYAHNKNPLPASLSFNFKGVNIGIDSDSLTDTIGQNFSFRLK